MKINHTFRNLLLAVMVTAGTVGCAPDEIPAKIDIPQGDLEFAAFEQEAKTVEVTANYDWNYEITEDEHGIIKDVEKTDNGLSISTNVNYASVAYTAKIVVSSGSSDAAATKTIIVRKAANATTYLNFLDSDLAAGFPVIVLESNADGTPSVRQVRVNTNNVLSVSLSQDQTLPEAKAEIAGNDWLTYEVSKENTDEGEVSVITLTGTFHEDTETARNVVIDIVSGNDDIDNAVVSKKIAVTQLPDAPVIVLPENDEIILEYDQTEVEFSIASNLNIGIDPGWDFTEDAFTVVRTEGRVTTFKVTMPQENWLNERRDYTVTVYDTDAESIMDAYSKSLYITHKAAPVAELTLGAMQVVVDNKTTDKIIEAAASLPGKVTVEARGADGEPAEWVTGAYSPDTETIALTFSPAAENDRTAEVTVTVGAGSNTAVQKMTVVQLGNKPSIVLDRTQVDLPGSGEAVTVKVTTNQSSWSVKDAAANPDFTVVSDVVANTITISASAISSGMREAEYTVQAGEASVILKVVQKPAYKVGDPFVVNGKTVGIVYKVDEQGLHGKAFSLTVHNVWDRLFWDYDISDYPGVAYPVSRTDGKENMDIIMSADGWENAATAFKWVYDLRQEQGVEWYIPAIDELTELVSYMSGGAAFLPSETGGLESTLDGSKEAEILSGWQKIRDIYKSYTGVGNTYGYDEEQYVAFVPYSVDENYEVSAPGDIRNFSEWGDGWVPVSYGEESATLWLSSTTFTEDSNMGGYYTRMAVEFAADPDHWQGMASVVNNLYFDCYASDGEAGDSGSIHPICRF